MRSIRPSSGKLDAETPVAIQEVFRVFIVNFKSISGIMRPTRRSRNSVMIFRLQGKKLPSTRQKKKMDLERITRLTPRMMIMTMISLDIKRLEIFDTSIGASWIWDTLDMRTEFFWKN